MTLPAGIGRFALFGAFSGALYAFWNFGFLAALGGETTTVSKFIEQLSNQCGAGLFYGVIVGAALRRPLGFRWKGWLAYAIAAALSYMAAVNLAIGLHQYQQSGLLTALSGAAAGATGAALLGIAAAVLSATVRRAGFFALTIGAGAVAGLLLPLALESDTLVMWIAFFAIWQAAYAAATAWGARID